MSEMLYRVVYVSRPMRKGDPAALEAEVADILAQSRKNNRDAGVTGALLFNTECFAQVLEGPLDEVMTTFERIQCDPRHKDTVVLQAGQVARREFADWSMAYAGRVEDGRLRFAALCPREGEEASESGARIILGTMRDVVLRTEAA